jgi:hypothetical protein
MIDRNRAFWALLGPAIAAAVSFKAAILVGVRAHAHDWYPLECCGGYDCGPGSMQTVAGPVYFADVPDASPQAFISEVTITNGLGFSEKAIVPRDFPRRDSPDGRLHACIVAGQLRCLFMPPGM